MSLFQKKSRSIVPCKNVIKVTKECKCKFDIYRMQSICVGQNKTNFLFWELRSIPRKIGCISTDVQGSKGSATNIRIFLGYLEK